MFFSPNQLLLYQLFLSHPSQSFYLQEIGRILGKKPGVFQRTLNKLEEDQFVLSEFQANARFFKLNGVYPLIAEIKSMIQKLGHPLNPFEHKISQLEKTKSKRRGRKKLSEKNLIEKKSSRKLLKETHAPIPEPSQKDSSISEAPTPAASVAPYAKSLAETRGDEILQKRLIPAEERFNNKPPRPKPVTKTNLKNSSQLELF